MFKQIIIKSHDNLNDRIKNLSEDNIIVALEGYPEYIATGEWTIGGTIIEEIYNEYLKDEHIPKEIGLYYIHSLICKRAANLWLAIKINL